MKINPTNDRVLVKTLEEKETIGGLEIVDKQSSEMKTGIVLEAGPDSTIKKGEKVLFNPAAGTKVRMVENGKYIDVRIMLSDTIQCTFSEE